MSGGEGHTLYTSMAAYLGKQNMPVHQSRINPIVCVCEVVVVIGKGMAVLL